MPIPNLLPDVELIVRDHLVGFAEVAAIVGTDAAGEVRVFTRLPDPPPAGPFVRLRRLPSPPVRARPLWLDAAAVQLDCYGGGQRQANRLAETVRAALDQLADGAVTEGVATGVDQGAMGYLPDPDLLTERGGARERYIVDVTVYTHPER